jgi:hypothetical protein
MDELADHHGVAPALCKQWPASPFLGPPHLVPPVHLQYTVYIGQMRTPG